ncbi:MAG: PEGA domain-containing protein [Methanolinea sp.]|jgi:hypothetical protein|nr:PEGA domain-containing protein [Methanolinea sp.]
MKRIQTILLALLLAVTFAGIATAEMTMQASAGGAGSVYTTGSIYVSSAPAGASAILDGGHAQLFTPGTFKGVEPGSHQVLVTLQGFQPYATTVKVSAGSTENVVTTLPPVTSPGGLSISSTPRGAGIYVDDIYMGKTNQVVGNLAAGPHRVVISEAGYETWEETIKVISGEVTPVTATLVTEINPAHGDLLVSSTPTGASVYLDGDFRGSTPSDDLLDINDLSPGTYTVAVKKPRYQDYSTIVTIQAGGKVQVLAPLQPAAQTAASVEITSTPGGADVFVNNVYMGITPLSFNDVQAGTYTVDIRMAGYTPFTSTGQVIPGQSVHVIAALSPVPTPTPTTKAPVGAFLVVMALAMVGITGIIFSRR